MSGVNNQGRRELRRPIAIYYEHPDWFRPLFQQLDERGVNWKKIEAQNHSYDAGSKEREYSLLFNRMSPSAWQRAWAIAFSIPSTTGTPGRARRACGEWFSRFRA
jgi:hypothetical protein